MSLKARKKQVVAFTSNSDAHLPFVERHLREPLIVFDKRDLAKGKELSYWLVGDQTVVSYNDEILDNISGVWFRKPQVIEYENLPVPDEYKTYSFDALEKHSVLFLTAFESATWVSDYYALIRANNKNLQMSLARRVGFRVPDTVITSSSNVAKSFIEKHPRCVSKSLTTKFPEINGTQRILLTTLIDKDSQPDLTSLYLAPSIFQEAIEAVHDIRVIVVGDQVFPAIMNSEIEKEGKHKYTRDNRLGNPHIEEVHTLPKDITNMCIAHNRSLGLNFGAIDLVLDEKGTHWFLEINPNGQWAFVEEATGQPIGRAIASLLEDGPNRPSLKARGLR
jgi:glutathione synthase/RimK-type ligase-like ATP-grasp enzyme